MYQMIAGAVLSGVGTGMAANAAGKRKKSLRLIADTPGVDFNKVYQESLGANLQALPQAQNLTSRTNEFDALELDRALERSMPGWGRMKEARAKNVEAWMKGEVPADVQANIARSAAGRALMGGYGGSGAMRNLVARDFGMSSMDLMGRGMQAAEMIGGGATTSRPTSVNRWLQIDPLTALKTRSAERELKMAYNSAAANAPGRSDVWAKHLQDVGGSLMGGGMGGGGSGGGMGGMAGMASMAGMMCWVAREVYGADNERWLLFRHYVIHMSPDWFYRLYSRYGERFAAWIKNKPRLKNLIRVWMDNKLEQYQLI